MTHRVSDSFRSAVDALTVEELRARGSYKWTAPGPGGFGAAVAELDLGAAPPVLDALAELSGRAAFGYLSDPLAQALAESTARFEQRRYGWSVDPGQVRNVPDVLKGLEIAITRYSRPGSPVILPTPAYMPFLVLPGFLGREIIQVRMLDDGAGLFRLDLDGLDAAFRAGGHLLILCNPYNPLGRVFTAAELAGVTEVVDRHGGLVFADEIHAPLVYAPARHIPYASTSDTAAGHTITATSASKAWNLAGLKCAEVILTRPTDAATWDALDVFAWHGASNAGVVATIAAFDDGGPWLDDATAYLDENRRLLAELLATHLPAVRYRPPDGTYLAWLDCTALDLPASPGALVLERARMTVVDGPSFGLGGAGALRFNFGTPQPVLRELVERLAAALNAG